MTKRYGDVLAVNSMDLDVAADEFVTLLGPSGCGKTTALRCMTGSLDIDAGQIVMFDSDVTRTPTHRRNIGLVFQNFALFPHMTVRENVAFPLKVRRVPASETRSRVSEALEIVRLDHVAERLPRELSGGQQQRVGLARAIVYRPGLVLFDEPLSNLDAKLRREMRYEIRRLRDELGFAAVYVTHDQEEALALSDRIAVMSDGVIHQIGEPPEIYGDPATLFVAEFLGNPNRVTGVVAGIDSDRVRVRVGEEELSARMSVNRVGEGDDVAVVIRPEAIRVGAANGYGGVNRWHGRVESVSFLGDRRECVVSIGTGFRLHAYLPAEQPAPSAELTRLEVPVADCRVFPL